jgi:hypothetical protein
MIRDIERRPRIRHLQYMSQFPQRFEEAKKTLGKNVRSTALRNAHEGAVAGLEVQVRRPIVGEILGELAGGASSGSRNIARCHRGVEAVSSYDLVDVSSGDLARVDEGVKPVDNDLGASKSQHGYRTTTATHLGCRFSERGEGEERGPKHCEELDIVGVGWMGSRRCSGWDQRVDIVYKKITAHTGGIAISLPIST